jgi:kumamolisin
MASLDNKLVPLKGSERAPLPGAEVVGPADSNRQISVTLVLRPSTAQAGTPDDALIAHARNRNREANLAAAEALYGADPADIARVVEFAGNKGLPVGKLSQAACTIELIGTLAEMSAAFGVRLEIYRQGSVEYRGRTGPVHLPRSLAKIVEAVLGLDDRPQATPKFQYYNQIVHPMAGTQPVKYTPVELAKLYRFPTGLDGKGQCIAIIELGGGYDTTDLQTYFAQLKVALPTVIAIGIDGGGNQPTSDPNGPDGEVMLDIEVAGAIAPGANIVVYFAPNTTKGFLDAINAAIHDTIRKPNIISISWGGPEKSWTAQALKAYNQAFKVAATVGITVCCASGDSGSSDGLNDGENHVDFPASSPYTLACGGTKLSSANNSITNETVWNEDPTRSATGGGVSTVFPIPAWQKKAKVPKPTASKLKTGRGLPDVAGDADPASGYAVRVDGVDTVIGGTSAVAPLWAGLLALVNQSLGKPVGYLNPLLYNTLAREGALNDIVMGNNGTYTAGSGWDACTGWGSPNGEKLLAALKPLV